MSAEDLIEKSLIELATEKLMSELLYDFGAHFEFISSPPESTLIIRSARVELTIRQPSEDIRSILISRMNERFQAFEKAKRIGDAA